MERHGARTLEYKKKNAMRSQDLSIPLEVASQCDGELQVFVNPILAVPKPRPMSFEAQMVRVSPCCSFTCWVKVLPDLGFDPRVVVHGESCCTFPRKTRSLL